MSNKNRRQHIPRKLRHKVFQRDGYRCRECGATNKETTLHIDHIIPVSKGGTNTEDNLQTLLSVIGLTHGLHYTCLSFPKTVLVRGT